MINPIKQWLKEQIKQSIAELTRELKAELTRELKIDYYSLKDSQEALSARITKHSLDINTMRAYNAAAADSVIEREMGGRMQAMNERIDAILLRVLPKHAESFASIPSQVKKKTRKSRKPKDMQKETE